VRQRLADLARNRGEDFQLVLTRYAIERLLYRHSRSEHCGTFVLKGAMLFSLWTGQPHRPTRDLDLLAKGENSAARLVQVFWTICAIAAEEDGRTFDPAMVAAERIKEDQEYEGVRVRCEARLGQARIDLPIDVGFGDAVTPREVRLSYPTMLPFPAPVWPMYPRETVVAEKFQTMVALGIANSRMKDFFDLWLLSRKFTFEGPLRCRAMEATFRRGNTPLPVQPPVALTREFGTDAAKVKQWSAFLKNGKLTANGTTLQQLCAMLADFLMPPTNALVARHAFKKTWPPEGPWT